MLCCTTITLPYLLSSVTNAQQNILSVKTNSFFGLPWLQLVLLWFFHWECSESIIPVITVIQVWLRPLLTANINLLCSYTSSTIREHKPEKCICAFLSHLLTQIHLSIFWFFLQKWKPKGTALQHMVSGLCLDSQTPAGPLVIMQCRPQVASQSWEPQIITWATEEEEGEGGADSAEGLMWSTSAHCLSPCWGVNCTFVMSTSNSCSSVTRETFKGLRGAKRPRSFCTELHPLRMLHFFYVI